MIAVDANLLLYAYNKNAAEHDRAKNWLERTFSSSAMIGLPLVSVLAFTRISTDKRLAQDAHSAAGAAEIVATWLDRENVLILEPGRRHWPLFFEMLIDIDGTGQRITDVHLAALAREHGATFYTNDRDFRVFKGLDVRFPLLDPE